MGDLGTFVPILLSLAALNGLPLNRTLILAGIVYVSTALYFRLPMPVQPLKAMAAIAIAEGLSIPLLTSGGFWVGIILLLLYITRRIDWLANYFTRPVVKGIQLGVGLMLIKASTGLITMASYPQYSSGALVSGVFPSLTGFISALWILVLPQLPLTLGNAVFAASDVAHDYFGKKAKRVTPGNLALSLGLSNVAIGACGGLPVCHGSGGLTAHFRFGARTGGATLILGCLFVGLGIGFKDLGDTILRSIPPWLLGLMLIYVGACHAYLVRGLKEKRTLAVSMGIIGLITSNLAYSLALGLVVENTSYIIYRIKAWRKVKVGSKDLR